jgi:hypothetical protein
MAGEGSESRGLTTPKSGCLPRQDRSEGGVNRRPEKDWTPDV